MSCLVDGCFYIFIPIPPQIQVSISQAEALNSLPSSPSSSQVSAPSAPSAASTPRKTSITMFDSTSSNMDMQLAMTETQIILIGIISKCCVLVSVEMTFTFCSILLQWMRVISRILNWSLDVQIALITTTMYMYVIDFSVTMICVLLQYEFWDKNQIIYKYCCHSMDNIFRYICGIKTINHINTCALNNDSSHGISNTMPQMLTVSVKSTSTNRERQERKKQEKLEISEQELQIETIL